MAFKQSFTQVLETFDNQDIPQWVVEGDGDINYDGTNGNPGGCLRFDESASGPISVMITPSKYLGEWEENGSFFFDLYVNRIGAVPIGDFPWVIEISGPGGLAYTLPNFIPEYEEWQTINVSTDSTNWTIANGNWMDIISNVNQIRLRIEYVEGDEYVLIDNVGLTFTPKPIEISGNICSEFDNFGFDGWTFTNTGTIETAETGGNPDGMLIINDALFQISKAFAPGKFRGDWSILGENAKIEFDIQVNFNSGNIYTGKEFLLQISNSLGTAIYPPNYAEIQEGFDQWKKISIPIDSSDWIVTSGSWEEILNNVEELVIEIEFSTGSEEVLFDNFCLISDNNTTTNLENNFLESSGVLNIFPNPVSDELFLRFSKVGNNVNELIISDSFGRIIFHSLLDSSDQAGVTVDVSGLDNGVYFVSLIAEKGQLTQRFVVQK